MLHVTVRELYVGYNPAEDTKYRPEGMLPGKWYRVFGMENGKLKLKDGGVSDAPFFHFIGENCRPLRVLHSNAVVCVPQYEVEGVRDPFPKVRDNNGETVADTGGF